MIRCCGWEKDSLAVIVVFISFESRFWKLSPALLATLGIEGDSSSSSSSSSIQTDLRFSCFIIFIFFYPSWEFFNHNFAVCLFSSCGFSPPNPPTFTLFMKLNGRKTLTTIANKHHTTEAAAAVAHDNKRRKTFFC